LCDQFLEGVTRGLYLTSHELHLTQQSKLLKTDCAFARLVPLGASPSETFPCRAATQPNSVCAQEDAGSISRALRAQIATRLNFSASNAPNCSAQWYLVKPFALASGDQFRTIIGRFGPASYGSSAFWDEIEEIVRMSAH
jgi:hypothetical protein